MIDDPIGRGLGAIASPPDEKDWAIDLLFAAAGLSAYAPQPATYEVPAPLPAVLNQGNTPKCVAFSSSWAKAWQDLRDQGSFNFDESRFFVQIGGGPNGAVVRAAFDRMLNYGYPVTSLDETDQHRIKAYYRVPVSEAALKAAIHAFGPVILGMTWFDSWFEPVSGVLPAPTSIVGGHAINAIGWDARGLRLRQSWGKNYGLSGDVFLPWKYLKYVGEAWKSVDRIETPASDARYRVSFAPRALVRKAVLGGNCISSWEDQTWGPHASTAPCEAPVIKKGCRSGQATVVLVTKGEFKSRYVHLGSGVSIALAQ